MESSLHDEMEALASNVLKQTPVEYSTGTSLRAWIRARMDMTIFLRLQCISKQFVHQVDVKYNL